MALNKLYLTFQYFSFRMDIEQIWDMCFIEMKNHPMNRTGINNEIKESYDSIG